MTDDIDCTSGQAPWRVESLFLRKLQADSEYYAQHPEEIELMLEDCFGEVQAIAEINGSGAVCD